MIIEQKLKSVNLFSLISYYIFIRIHYDLFQKPLIFYSINNGKGIPQKNSPIFI